MGDAAAATASDDDRSDDSDDDDTPSLVRSRCVGAILMCPRAR